MPPIELMPITRHCLYTSITWGASTRIGKSEPNSVAKESRGERVPEVRITDEDILERFIVHVAEYIRSRSSVCKHQWCNYTECHGLVFFFFEPYMPPTYAKMDEERSVSELEQ